MLTNEKFTEIIENVELILLQQKALRAEGPHFRIIHRFRRPGLDCAAGEEIAAVFWMVKGRECLVRLSCAMLILFDYLARHSHLPQTAAQIVLGISADPFYRKHARNASADVRLASKISPSEVKVYVQRIRTAIDAASREAAIFVDPAKVLISEKAASNRVLYRLKGTFEWVHTDHPSRDME